MKAANTLAAIDRAIEAHKETPHRMHLGASVIGKPCERQLWYLFRWAGHEKHSPRMLRLFNRGHLEEKRFVAYLRSVGMEIWEAGESGDNKQAMRYSDHNGHFGGTPDGVGRNSPDLPTGQPAVLEFKTHNAKSFTKLQENGLLGTKFEHFVQMQVSMHKLQIQYGLYCAVNKDDDDLWIEVLQYSPREPLAALDKAKRVIDSEVPLKRIADTPASMACKYCTFQRLCHFGDVAVDRNCRTCAYGRPDKHSLWICLLKGVALGETAQRAACDQYSANTAFQGRQP